MKTLKYKIIKNPEQYREYCNALETLLESSILTNDDNDEIELLTFLIGKWDADNSFTRESDPVEILHSLMKEHNLKAKDLVSILGVSKGLISDILNYKKGFSKELIRLLSQHFKVSQEAFNRPYRLVNPLNSHIRNASVMNTTKKVKFA